MTTSIRRLRALPRLINAPSLCLLSIRKFSISPTLAERRKIPLLEQDISEEELMNQSESYEYAQDDAPTIAHMMLRDERQTLHYLRLIEHEMPKLVAFRKPFVPPTDATPVVVRSIEYVGEKHPATNKRVIVAPVDKLPLRSEVAIHKFKLLAGPRWTPNPPTDAGLSKTEEWGNGFVKISCESLANPAMNLKWGSDVLDRLIAEANNKLHDKEFKKLPVDTRHVYAKVRKAKEGDHLKGNRPLHRPSIRDFPQSWLPQ